MSVPMKSLKERAAIARKSSIFAGLLYVLGCIGFAVLSFFPLLEGGVWAYGELNLTTFWKPFAEYIPNFAKLTENLAVGVSNLLIALLYILMPVVTIINALRAIAKLDHLTMPGRRKYGYNQNKLALDKLANIFAGSFAVIVLHTLVLRYMLTDTNTVTASWTLVFYVALGIAGFIHLLSGLVGGSVSRFATRDGAVEFPRRHGSFSPFLRNLFQFAAIGGILFFLGDVTYSSIVLGYLCNPAGIMQGGIFEVIEVLAWLLTVLFVLLMLRHALNPTEFNACEPDDKGRKTMRFATFFAFLFLLAIASLPVIKQLTSGGAFDWSLFNLNMLYSAAVSLGMFIIECIMARFPLLKKRYRELEDPDEADDLVFDVPEDEEEEEEEPAPEQPVVETPVAAPVPAPAPEPEPSKPQPPTERTLRARSIKQRWIAISRAANAEEEIATTQAKTWAVRCPYCFESVEVEDGLTAVCPKCGKKFALKKSFRSLPAQASKIAKFADGETPKKQA